MSNRTEEKELKELLNKAAYPMVGQIVPAEEEIDGKVVEFDMQLPPNHGLTKLELVALKILETHLTVSEDTLEDLNGNLMDLIMRKAGLFLTAAHQFSKS